MAPLIIQLARGGAVAAQVERDRPPAVAAGDAAIDLQPVDAAGRIVASADVGRVVLSVPSPEALTRDPGAVHRVVDGAGAGPEPLIVEVEAAEELRDDELAVVLDAARHTSRNVILRVIGDA